MTANGDVTVAEAQRNCSNYTCDNYYSKALSAGQKTPVSAALIQRVAAAAYYLSRSSGNPQCLPTLA
ncbi:hypothetical protein NQZ68_012635 [Dissostichus eleginoides]|nr:hypothetical protein NQZ68_012635 [Dissostichus eleginoides]